MTSWDESGRPEQIGDSDCREILIQVDDGALTVWRAAPDTLFHVETRVPVVYAMLSTVPAYCPRRPAPLPWRAISGQVLSETERIASRKSCRDLDLLR